MSSATASTGLVFPGQGSQKPGMGRDFSDAFAVSRRVYEAASDEVGIDMAALCFEENDRLNQTEFTQPAILTTEIAMLEAARSEFGFSPQFYGGHSLGEYTALVAAGVLELAAAVRLVRERGRRMQEAVPAGEGAMAAVIGRGLDVDAVQSACDGLTVDVANFNSPDQVVLSGAAADIKSARSRLAEAFGKALRVVPLRVSAPFHSRLMRGIEEDFRATLASLEPAPQSDAAACVTSNYTGGFHEPQAGKLIDNLTRQIGSAVRWVDNMHALLETCGTVIEIGPGKPLRGFFEALGHKIDSVTDLASAREHLGG